jgi:hypothetical protein
MTSCTIRSRARQSARSTMTTRQTANRISIFDGAAVPGRPFGSIRARASSRRSPSARGSAGLELRPGLRPSHRLCCLVTEGLHAGRCQRWIAVGVSRAFVLRARACRSARWLKQAEVVGAQCAPASPRSAVVAVGRGVPVEEMGQMQWVKPKVVAQVRFVEWNQRWSASAPCVSRFARGQSAARSSANATPKIGRYGFRG